MTGTIPSSYKDNRGERTVIEDGEDDIDELPDLNFVKDTVRVFY